MPSCVKCNSPATGLLCDRCAAPPEPLNQAQPAPPTPAAPVAKVKARRPPWFAIAAAVIATPLIAQALMVTAFINRPAPDPVRVPLPAASAPLTPAPRAQIEARDAQARQDFVEQHGQPDPEIPGGQQAQVSSGTTEPSYRAMPGPTSALETIRRLAPRLQMQAEDFRLHGGNGGDDGGVWSGLQTDGTEPGADKMNMMQAEVNQMKALVSQCDPGERDEAQSTTDNAEQQLSYATNPANWSH